MNIDFANPCLRVFEKAQYALDFARGTVYMSAIQRYREKEQQDSDIGDRYEGIRTVKAMLFLAPPDERLQAFPQSAFSAKPCQVDIPLRIPEVEESVLLCATSLSEGALETIGAREGRYLARFGRQYSGFLTRHTAGFTEGFGVIFSLDEMALKLKEYARANDFCMIHHKVEYGPLFLDSTDAEELEEGCPPIYKYLFHKRGCAELDSGNECGYADQFEYRFAVLPKPGDTSGRLRGMLNDKQFLVANVGPLQHYQLVYFDEGIHTT